MTDQTPLVKMRGGKFLTHRSKRLRPDEAVRTPSEIEAVRTSETEAARTLMVKVRGGKFLTRRSQRLRPDEAVQTPSEIEAVLTPSEIEAVRTSKTEAAQTPSETEAVAIPSDEPVPKPKRKATRKKPVDEAPTKEDREALSNDDCEVVGDEDCDEVRYAIEESGNREEVPKADCEGEGIEEVMCKDIEAEFGVIVREVNNGDESDADSGDDIWDDERILEPR